MIQKKMKRWGTADAAMVAACFFWALGTVLTKDAVSDLQYGFKIFIFNSLRLLIATILLFLYCRLTGKKTALLRKDVLRMALLAFFGFFLFMAIFHYGLTITTAAHAGILIGTIPLFIVIISTVTGVERATMRIVGGVAVGFAGVAALTLENGASIINTGDLLVIVSCVCWAVYTVYGKALMEHYAPIVTIAWIFFFSTIYHIPLFFMQLNNQSFDTISARNWVNLVVAAIGPLFISNALYFFSLDKIGPSLVGIYTNLEPGFTLLLAYGIGIESFSIRHVIGFLAIMGGICLIKIDRN